MHALPSQFRTRVPVIFLRRPELREHLMRNTHSLDYNKASLQRSMDHFFVLDLQRAQHLSVTLPVAVKAVSQCYSRCFICVPTTPGLLLNALPSSYRLEFTNISGFALCESLREQHPSSIIDICVPILKNDFQVIRQNLLKGIASRVINNVSFYHDSYSGSVHSAEHLQPISSLADDLNFDTGNRHLSRTLLTAYKFSLQ